jgi:Flp pilus assembly protein TadB
LIILKIFTSDFYAIGALFAVYGAAVMAVAIYRRYEGNRQFFEREESESESSSATDDDRQQHSSGLAARRPTVLRNKFRTSGNSVALLTALSLAAYVALMVLIWTLAS